MQLSVEELTSEKKMLETQVSRGLGMLNKSPSAESVKMSLTTSVQMEKSLSITSCKCGALQSVCAEHAALLCHKRYTCISLTSKRLLGIQQFWSWSEWRESASSSVITIYVLCHRAIWCNGFDILLWDRRAQAQLVAWSKIWKGSFQCDRHQKWKESKRCDNSVGAESLSQWSQTHTNKTERHHLLFIYYICLCAQPGVAGGCDVMLHMSYSVCVCV